MALPMGPRAYPNAAFILSLIGGILILLGSIADAVLLAIGASLAAGIGFGGFAALLIALAVIALIFGLLVLLGAIMLRNHPESAKTWGILILVFSLISFIGGGGFYIGAILGLVGGILAIVWTPPAAPMMGQMGAPGGWTAAPPPSMTPGMGAAPMGGGKVCGSCGSANAAGAQFCAKCGAPMPP
jgi:hypothetical protein